MAFFFLEPPHLWMKLPLRTGTHGTQVSLQNLLFGDPERTPRLTAAELSLQQQTTEESQATHCTARNMS